MTRAEVPVRLLAVAFGVPDPTAVGRFWATLLGREAVSDIDGVLVPGDETQVGLRFVERSAGGTRPNRTHLHLTSERAGDLERTAATALGLGARHIDVGQLPEEGHVVLADPGGVELCVIPPGNDYLAGCGFLGEVAGEGSREVGIFWSEALGWPLVWDQDEETAIQSPHGGTKVAWGGPPLRPVEQTNPQRFDLVVADVDLAAEVDRLIGLGATNRRTGADGAVLLADPDGVDFRVSPGPAR